MQITEEAPPWYEFVYKGCHGQGVAPLDPRGWDDGTFQEWSQHSQIYCHIAYTMAIDGVYTYTWLETSVQLHVLQIFHRLPSLLAVHVVCTYPLFTMHDYKTNHNYT